MRIEIIILNTPDSRNIVLHICRLKYYYIKSRIFFEIYQLDDVIGSYVTKIHKL